MHIANPWETRRAAERHHARRHPPEYQAWIEPKYRQTNRRGPCLLPDHSHGTSSTGSRAVQVDATLVAGMARLPLGVFARTIEGGGSATVTRESWVFSTGCVYNRSKIEMGTSIDAAYGIRAGVHSAQIITDANGNTPTCSVGNKAIHKDRAAATPPTPTTRTRSAVPSPAPAAPAR